MVKIPSINIEALPPGPEEIEIKIIQADHAKLMADIKKNMIATSDFVSNTIASSTINDMQIAEHFKKTDQIGAHQITNGGAMIVMSSTGRASTLGQMLERVLELESQAMTNAHGTGQLQRIDQLEKQNAKLIERVKELEEHLKDIPTSRPAW